LVVVDLDFLNDEILVVNQRTDLLLVDEHEKLLKMMELIIEVVVEEEEVEKQVMIENEMDDEIDDD
jgi:hypothetical protein